MRNNSIWTAACHVINQYLDDAKHEITRNQLLIEIRERMREIDPLVEVQDSTVDMYRLYLTRKGILKKIKYGVYQIMREPGDTSSYQAILHYQKI